MPSTISQDQVKDIGQFADNILKEYNKDKEVSSMSFVEWITDYTQRSLLNTNSDIDRAQNQMNFYSGKVMSANSTRNLSKRPDVNPNNINNKIGEYANKLIDSEKDYDSALDGAVTKNIAIYIAAKRKLESRGFWSKLFHPIRTYRESSLLGNLKDSIKRIGIPEAAFDNVDTALKDGTVFQAMKGITLNNGQIVMDREAMDYVAMGENVFETKIDANNEIAIADSDKMDIQVENDLEENKLEFNEKDIINLNGNNDINNDSFDLDDDFSKKEEDFIKGLNDTFGKDNDDDIKSEIVNNKEKDLEINIKID